MNTLTQVVQGAQVIAPLGIDALQQYHALKLREVVHSNLIELALEHVVGSLNDRSEQVLIRDGAGRLNLALQVQRNHPFITKHLLQGFDIPLFFHRLGGHILTHQILEAPFTQGCDLGRQVLRIQNCIALLVDDLALVVGNVIVFQQLLAHIKIACFDLALRALNAPGHDAGFNGLTFRHFQPIHDRLDTITRKDAHQRVVQAEVEPRRARVSLSARTPTQLVIDTPRFMTLRGDNAQPPQSLHMFVLSLPLRSHCRYLLLFGSITQRRICLDGLHKFADVATQHNVGTATRHVGRNRDHLRAAGLGHNVCFACMLLGIEHLVRQLFLFQQLRDDF